MYREMERRRNLSGALERRIFITLGKFYATSIILPITGIAPCQFPIEGLINIGLCYVEVAFANWQDIGQDVDQMQISGQRLPTQHLLPKLCLYSVNNISWVSVCKMLFGELM